MPEEQDIFEATHKAFRYPDFDPAAKILPVPVAGILDPPCCCVGINYEWIPFIAGMLDRLGYGDAWNDTEANRDRAYQEVQKLQALFGGDETLCNCGQVSTAPNVTNITTVYDITTMIDKSQTQVETVYNSWPTDNPTMIGDGNIVPMTLSIPRDNALCKAFVDFVTAWMAAYEQIRDQAVNGGLTGLVGDVLGFFDGAIKFASDVTNLIDDILPDTMLIDGFIFGQRAAQAIASGMIDAAKWLAGVEDIPEIDKTKVEEIACALWNCFRSTGLTFDDWLDCNTDYAVLDALDWAVNTADSYLIARMWASGMQHEDSYFSFMGTVDGLIGAINLTGEIPDCPCCKDATNTTDPVVVDLIGAGIPNGQVIGNYTFIATVPGVGDIYNADDAIIRVQFTAPGATDQITLGVRTFVGDEFEPWVLEIRAGCFTTIDQFQVNVGEEERVYSFPAQDLDHFTIKRLNENELRFYKLDIRFYTNP